MEIIVVYCLKYTAYALRNGVDGELFSISNLCLLADDGSTLISGPVPDLVIAPLNSLVKIRCRVNTSELRTTGGKFVSFGWNTNGPTSATTDGVVRSSTLTLTVAKENLIGVEIQCRVFLEDPLSQIFSRKCYSYFLWYCCMCDMHALYTLTIAQVHH